MAFIIVDNANQTGEVAGAIDRRAVLTSIVKGRGVWVWFWPVFLIALMAVRDTIGDRAWWSAWTMRLSEPLWPLLALLVLTCSPVPKGGRKHWMPRTAAFFIGLAGLHPVWGSEGQREGLKVLQLNMEHGLEDADKVAALIEREAPDVLCLEEAGPLSYFPKRTPTSLIEALRPYDIFHSQFEAIAVRGDILNHEILPLDEMSHEKAWYDQKVITSVQALVKGQKLRIAVVHFSPRAAPNRGFIEGNREFGRVRESQHQALVNFIADHSGDRMIVAGDFDGQPIGPNYRLIAANATDCFKAAGSGFGYTLRANVPHKRVDYIFVRNLLPTACYVLNDVVSDHRAVVAWVK